MHVISVNVALPHPLDLSGRVQVTGIAKQPVAGPVAVHALGLEGDGVGEPEHHGGADQAVYAYSADDYAWWSEQLGRELAPGSFGENLTIAGLPSAERSVGDRLRMGDEVLLEVTAPRIPCATFSGRMGDPGWVKRFAKARRPGLYLRVLQTGSVRAGDAVELDESCASPIAVVELMRLHYERKLPAARYERALEAPVAARFRAMLEHRVERARARV